MKTRTFLHTLALAAASSMAIMFLPQQREDEYEEVELIGPKHNMSDPRGLIYAPYMPLFVTAGGEVKGHLESVKPMDGYEVKTLFFTDPKSGSKPFSPQL